MIKTKIHDGTGAGHDATVRPALKADGNAVWVNIAGVSQSVVLPIFDGIVGERFEQYAATSGGSIEMAVDGDPTPVEFTINADDERDIIVTAITISGIDSGVIMGDWFALNNPLSNGVLLDIRSDGVSFDQITWIKTHDLLVWSSIGGFDGIFEVGADSIRAIREYNPRFIIRKSGTFGGSVGNDYIKLTVQDDIDRMDEMRCLVRGVYTDPGVY